MFDHFVPHFTSYFETAGIVSHRLHANVFDFPVKNAGMFSCGGTGGAKRATAFWSGFNMGGGSTCDEINKAVANTKNYAEASFTADAGTAQQHILHVHSEAAMAVLRQQLYLDQARQAQLADCQTMYQLADCQTMYH